MRFIEKKEICKEFDDFIKSNKLDEYLEQYCNQKNLKTHPWKKFDENLNGTLIKKQLSNHLYKEQKGLCIYCQQQLNPNNKELSNFAHIEHLKPKDKNKFPELTFEYNNLTVSCNGFDCTKFSLTKDFCGHKKSSKFKEDKFLNPIEIKDIEKYFEYTIEGKIRPSKSLTENEKSKAEYMIELLDLKNKELNKMRKESYLSLIEISEELDLKLFFDEKSDLFPAFYSMTKQLFFFDNF